MSNWTTHRKAMLERSFLRLPPLGTRSWRVAASLLALRIQTDALWPTRSKVSDGTIGDAAHASRDSDHNPWVKDGATGVVTAIDITHDPSKGCDANQIVQALVVSRDARIKYIIWNRRIISASVSPWIWRSYNGRNSHAKHLHLSVESTKRLYDDKSPWNLVQL